MTHTVLRLNAHDAALGWEKAGVLLLPAIARSAGLYDPDDVRALVTDPGSGWNLWLIADGTKPLGAWTTVPRSFPKGRLLEVTFAGGENMADWYDFALSETDKFAIECGCRGVRIYGRRGWEKFGYRAIGFVLERTLT